MDPEKGAEVRKNPVLEATARASYEALSKDDWGRKSLSGHERDRFFLSRSGRQFSDLSLLSGADHKGDGRACALLDYNGDGRLDIAVANTNRPTLLLWKNELQVPNRYIELRLTGGAGMNRDAIGARVTVEAGGRKLLRELHCGEGNAAQNSKALLVGLGSANKADRVTVRWPDGTTFVIPGPVPAGQRLLITPGGSRELE